MICKNCGSAMESDAKFCVKCGCPADNSSGTDTYSVVTSQTENTKKKSFIPIIVLVSVIVAVVAIVSTVIVVRSSPSRIYQKQLDLGYRYLEELDYERAIAAFEAAIEIEPKNVEPYKGLVEAYLNLEDYDELADVYESAFDYLDADDLDDLNDLIVDELADLIADAYDDRNYDQVDDLIGVLYDIDEAAAEKNEVKYAIADATDDVEEALPEDEPEELYIDDEETNVYEEQYDIVDGVAHHLYFDHNIETADETFFDNIINASKNNSKSQLLELICSSGMNTILEKYCENSASDYYFENSYDSGDYSLYTYGFFLYKNYKIYLSMDLYRSSESDYDNDERMVVCIPLENSSGVCLRYSLSASLSDDSDWIKSIEYGSCPCKDGMFNGYAIVKIEQFDGQGQSSTDDYQGNIVNGLREGEWDLEFSFHNSDGEDWYGGGMPTYGNGVDTEYGSESFASDIIDDWYVERVDGGIIVYPY